MTSHASSPLSEQIPLDEAVAVYVAAAEGDATAAIRAAVADVLELHAEAQALRAVLRTCVSRGYVRGRHFEAPLPP